MRKLNFSETLGTVQLTLSWDDGISQQFTVTPFQAIIISLFNKPDGFNYEVTISLSEIKDKLNIDETSVLDALHFWSSCGALCELENYVF